MVRCILLSPLFLPKRAQLYLYTDLDNRVVPPQQQMMSQSIDILKEVKMDGDKFTPEQIEKFTSDPEYYLRFVKAVEEEINGKFPLVYSISSSFKG